MPLSSLVLDRAEKQKTNYTKGELEKAMVDYPKPQRQKIEDTAVAYMHMHIHVNVLSMTLNCTRWGGLGWDFKRLGTNVIILQSPLCWATLGQGAVPIKLLSQGYDFTSLLPCGLSVLGKARGVNSDIKPGTGVPKAVWQDNATRETPAVPKQHRHSSFPWIHRPPGKGTCCLNNSSSSIHPAQAM